MTSYDFSDYLLAKEHCVNILENVKNLPKYDYEKINIEIKNIFGFNEFKDFYFDKITNIDIIYLTKFYNLKGIINLKKFFEIYAKDYLIIWLICFYLLSILREIIIKFDKKEI